MAMAMSFAVSAARRDVVKLFAVLFLLTLTLPGECEDIWKCKHGAITPRDSLVLLGQDIILTCSYNRTHRNPVQLAFKKGHSEQPVDEQYITYINDTSIKMVLPSITEQDIKDARLALSFRCEATRSNNQTVCVDHSHVTLDYYPVAVRNISCRIEHFRNMTCRWELGVDYVHDQNIDVKFEYIGDNISFTNVSNVNDYDWREFMPCPYQTKTSCVLNAEHFMGSFAYIVRVTVTYKPLNISAISDTIAMDSNDILEPDKVEGLEVTRISPRCVVVKWKSTVRGFATNITYFSSCSNYRTFLIREHVNRARVCGLTPFSQYTFTAKKRLVDYEGVERGFWSQPSTVNKIMPGDVPASSPETQSLFAEVFPTHAVVYWQPLDVCEWHAAQVHYNIYSNTTNGTLKREKQNVTGFSASVDISKNDTVEITVEAENVNGSAEQRASFMLFPHSTAWLLSELIVQYNQTEESCRTVSVKVKERHPLLQNISHTLVFCEGLKVCEKPLHIVTMALGVTSYVLPPDHCYGDYRYGLVTNVQGQTDGGGHWRNSGIHWSNCEYVMDEVPHHALKLEASKLQPKFGFHVSWDPYDCTDRVYIIEYQLEYCTSDGKSCNNCGAKQSIFIDRTEDSYSMADLEAGTTVCVWIRAVSLKGPGPYNDHPISHEVLGADNSGITIGVTFGVAFGVIVLFLLGLAIRKCYNWFKSMKAKATSIRLVLPKDEELDPYYTSITDDNHAEETETYKELDETKELLCSGRDDPCGDYTDSVSFSGISMETIMDNLSSGVGTKELIATYKKTNMTAYAATNVIKADSEQLLASLDSSLQAGDTKYGDVHGAVLYEKPMLNGAAVIDRETELSNEAEVNRKEELLDHKASLTIADFRANAASLNSLMLNISGLEMESDSNPAYVQADARSDNAINPSTDTSNSNRIADSNKGHDQPPRKNASENVALTPSKVQGFESRPHSNSVLLTSALKNDQENTDAFDQEIDQHSMNAMTNVLKNGKPITDPLNVIVERANVENPSIARDKDMVSEIGQGVESSYHNLETCDEFDNDDTLWEDIGEVLNDSPSNSVKENSSNFDIIDENVTRKDKDTSNEKMSTGRSFSNDHNAAGNENRADRNSTNENSIRAGHMVVELDGDGCKMEESETAYKSVVPWDEISDDDGFSDDTGSTKNPDEGKDTDLDKRLDSLTSTDSGRASLSANTDSDKTDSDGQLTSLKEDGQVNVIDGSFTSGDETRLVSNHPCTSGNSHEDPNKSSVVDSTASASSAAISSTSSSSNREMTGYSDTSSNTGSYHLWDNKNKLQPAHKCVKSMDNDVIKDRISGRNDTLNCKVENKNQLVDTEYIDGRMQDTVKNRNGLKHFKGMNGLKGHSLENLDNS